MGTLSQLRVLASLLLLGVVFVLISSSPVRAQEEAIDIPAGTQLDEAQIIPETETEATPPPVKEEFYRAEVIKIVSERQEEFGLNGTRPTIQNVQVRYLEGSKEGQTEEIEYGFLHENQRLKIGKRVIVITPNDQAFVFDQYRLRALGFIVALFALLTIAFARWRGVTSLLGLGVSVLVITMFIIPQIIAGSNPLVVSLIGALIIATVSIYLAHGFNKRTSIAVAGTLTAVVIAIVLAMGFVSLAGLSGSGSEEAYFLQTSPIGQINLRGLLLGGIIIGALGVLDDITTSQSAAVYEIWRANPKLSRRELFRRGIAVGREHITSLVNTLALAYVGASFPALLLFTVYQRPWWVVANTEAIAEEVIRTLVGSIALMCAVPITTFLAAAVFSRMQISSPMQPQDSTPHVHS